jgi:hypothetical protein
MVIRRSRSVQCLMSKIFETTYHHKLSFNSKDIPKCQTKLGNKAELEAICLVIETLHLKHKPHGKLAIDGIELNTQLIGKSFEKGLSHKSCIHD